jgi:8-oxo-dGTP pyrophosphatase MutT (NUDIX family)
MSDDKFIFNQIFIQSRLKKYNSPSRLSMKHEFFINSAVMFLILPHENKSYDLVMIRRTINKNDKHSGEMSFPGGKFDPNIDNDYLDTALRELEEELAIEKGNVEIIGCIDDHLTPKGFIITPFVGYINEDQYMNKEDEEVSEIVKIPITFFADKKNYKERTYFLKKDLIGVGKFNYISPMGIKYVIFGATSHIIVNFIDTVYGLGLMNANCRRVRCEDIKDKLVK